MPVEVGSSTRLLEVATENQSVAEPNLEAYLPHFSEIINIPGVRLVDAFCIGILNPDTILSKLKVEKASFNALMDRLLGLEFLRVRKMNVYPYGSPVINEIHIDVELTPHR